MLSSQKYHGIFDLTFRSFLDFLSPLQCSICNSRINAKNFKYDFLCMGCYLEMPPMPDSAYVLNKLISSIDKDNLSISNAFSLFSIKDDSRFLELIHLLKYNGHRKIGAVLGRELGQFIRFNSKNDYDFIVPVPIHSARIRERGFNQSDIIALALSIELSVPLNTNLIFRSKYTKTQTLLNSDERKKNVEYVFKPKRGFERYSLKNILIVDDVLTTGSTINSAANCLLQMGAKRIDCASLAVA